MQTFSLVYALKNAGYQVTTLCYFEYEESVVQQYKYDRSEVILLKWKRIIFLDVLIEMLFRNADTAVKGMQNFTSSN
ncbi:MAG: hypothetical protein ABFD10_03435 [Prolixibacteraceae bacterium]